LFSAILTGLRDAGYHVSDVEHLENNVPEVVPLKLEVELGDLRDPPEQVLRVLRAIPGVFYAEDL
ncbi:MAG: hypothetical protein PHS97_06120, partial [Oscillospiraceae bacterium]|nr:hypothetical protein [Oscillospiraceae bacterium]